MVSQFKFLRCPIATAHDGGVIYVGEYFYTMNKEEFPSVSGVAIPKYTIVTRWVHPKNEDKFKPDYEVLWYFRSKQNAEYLKRLWEDEDEYVRLHDSNIRTGGGERIYHESDFTITFGEE